MPRSGLLLRCDTPLPRRVCHFDDDVETLGFIRIRGVGSVDSCLVSVRNLELGLYTTGFRFFYDPRSEVYGSQDPRETALNLVRSCVGMSSNSIWSFGPDALEACQALERQPSR